MFLPVDLWIDYETFFWGVTSKTTDNFSIYFIRIISWITLVYSSIIFLGFSTNAFVTDLSMGAWNDIRTQTIVEVLSSLFGLMTSISYIAQVNAYVPYL